MREECDGARIHAVREVDRKQGAARGAAHRAGLGVRARARARQVASSTAWSARHPDTLTGKMAKDARGGRIFLDYLRNAEGASAVAPYSTRNLSGPSCSVPLAWDELDRRPRHPGLHDRARDRARRSGHRSVGRHGPRSRGNARAQVRREARLGRAASARRASASAGRAPCARPPAPCRRPPRGAARVTRLSAIDGQIGVVDRVGRLADAPALDVDRDARQDGADHRAQRLLDSVCENVRHRAWPPVPRRRRCASSRLVGVVMTLRVGLHRSSHAVEVRGEAAPSRAARAAR